MDRELPLPTGRALVRRILLLTGAYSVAAVAAVMLYLVGLLRLPAEQWRGFVELVGLALLGIFPAMILVHRGIFARIRRGLDRRAEGVATRQELRQGFAAVADFPRYWFSWGLAWWALGGALVGGGMWLRYPDFGLLSLATVLAATVSAAFVTDAWFYLLIKRVLEPVRLALAAELAGPAERRALTRSVPLRTKLLVATTSVILVTVVYAAFLSHELSRRAVEQSALPAGSHSPEAATAGSGDGLAQARAEAQLRFGALLLFSALMGVGVAWLLARDLGSSAARLEREAGRVASGDLRGGVVLESEDEMGELARSFEGMEASLRVVASSVSGAAGRMQSASLEIAAACHGLTAVTGAQASGVEQATRSVASIGAEVRSIAAASEALAVSTDATSGAAAGLEDTGGELSGSAATLQSAAEEVGAAIEQLGRSIARIAEGCDDLAELADGASASVREAALAARDADAGAERMARLSEEVVELAAGGRARVQDTIRGMGAVAKATETAQQVMAELAASTRGIGSVVDVIDGIADETGLLALNAAIIAAQSGPHGRAFAVVAQEIGDLAQRVLANTKAIADLVARVQARSGEAEAAIARGALSAQQGVELAEKAGSSLERINESARESGRSSAEIAASVRGQSEAAERVADLMQRVHAGIEAIRQAVQEQGRGSGLLRQSATSLRDVAGQVRGASNAQERSARDVRESVARIRDAVSQINAALRQQAAACTEAAGFLAQVSSGTGENEQSVRGLERAMAALRDQAAVLRQEVLRFRV